MTPYYDDGNGIVIYHGDCREILPYLPKVDLVLTDPPYLFEPSGGGIMGKSAKDGYSRTNLKRLDDLNCCDFDPSWFLPLIGSAQLIVFTNKALLPNYLSFAKDGGRLFDLHFLQKNNPTPVKESAFLPELEYIVLSKNPRSYFDNSQPFELYRKAHYVQQLKGDQKCHPAEKPVDVLAQYISVCCPNDGTVLDPFMGSGTTLRAGKDLGRKCIGIEIEEKYCEIAAKRLAQEVLSL